LTSEAKARIQGYVIGLKEEKKEGKGWILGQRGQG